jgi:hypothetical protein
MVQALILNADAAGIARTRLRSAEMAVLDQRLLLMPITDDLLRELGEEDPSDPQLVGCFEGLSARVEEFAVSLSRVAPIAYVETEYFGGVGVQGAAVWIDGARRLLIEPCESGPINDALRLLGVVAREGVDEFDSVGLGRHRSNKVWLDSRSVGTPDR